MERLIGQLANLREVIALVLSWPEELKGGMAESAPAIMRALGLAQLRRLLVEAGFTTFRV